MELIKPSVAFAESFREALDEFDGASIRGFWNARGSIEDIAAYIEDTQRRAAEQNIPDDWVPASTFWLIDDRRFIGHCNIRHRLNPSLERIGGHIGYFIRPSEHAKGYGSQILKLALIEARALGITRALITCDADNVPSRKIIEKNGGVLQDQIDVDGRQVLRFGLTCDYFADRS